MGTDTNLNTRKTSNKFLKWFLSTLLISVLIILTNGINATEASAKWFQPNCSSLNKQSKKAKQQIRKANKQIRRAKKQSRKTAARVSKRKAQQRLKRLGALQRQCRNNLMVWNQVKDIHIVGGTDYIGNPSDDVWCSSGAWKTYSIARTTGWRVIDARVQDSKNYTAGIQGYIGKAGIGIARYEVGIVRKGDDWEYGIIDDGVIQKSAPATLTNAKDICSTL